MSVKMIGSWRTKKNTRTNATSDNNSETMVSSNKTFSSRDLFLPRGFIFCYF